jgi:hypothetical protein
MLAEEEIECARKSLVLQRSRPQGMVAKAAVAEQSLDSDSDDDDSKQLP